MTVALPLAAIFEAAGALASVVQTGGGQGECVGGVPLFSPAIRRSPPAPTTPSDDGQRAGASSTPVDACALITNAEIEAALGESVKERRPGTQATGGLQTTQCFFGTSSARSVSLI
jgi:hypothetical protein